MNITDLLTQMGGIDSVAKELGVPASAAQAGAAALLPAILGGFKKQAAPTGLEGLAGMLGGLGGGGLLDAVLAPKPTPVDQGNAVLGQIFGSKDVSRQVAGHAAAQSGLSADVLKKMLPMLAMMVAGYMAKQSGGNQQSGGGGLGGMLGNAVGAALGGGKASGGGLGGMLGNAVGAALGGGKASGGGGLGGLARMLDMNGDGNPLDDILGMASKMTGR